MCESIVYERYFVCVFVCEILTYNIALHRCTHFSCIVRNFTCIHWWCRCLYDSLFPLLKIMNIEKVRIKQNTFILLYAVYAILMHVCTFHHTQKVYEKQSVRDKKKKPACHHCLYAICSYALFTFPLSLSLSPIQSRCAFIFATYTVYRIANGCTTVHMFDTI